MVCTAPTHGFDMAASARRWVEMLSKYVVVLVKYRPVMNSASNACRDNSASHTHARNIARSLTSGLSLRIMYSQMSMNLPTWPSASLTFSK